MEDFNLTLKIPVEWRDIDAAHHVNNVIYLQWAESARVAYLLQLNGGSLISQDNISPIVGWLDCKYIRPVSFPDTVIVGVKKEAILDDRMVLETRIFSHKDDRLVAISKQHIMAYNVKYKQKAEIPLSWRYDNS